MTPFFEMASPFPTEYGRVKLLEPPGSPAWELRERLLAGRYDKPFVLDDGETRSLRFNMNYIQSLMRIADPWALDVTYTRKMMAFLLFNRRPKTIVLLGLGGGSLAKFCYRNFPAAQVTAVELDPDVIAFRDEFLVPRDDERFRVLQGNAVDHVAGLEKTDVLLVDAFDREGVAPDLVTLGFFEQARRALSGHGLLVMNIAGEKDSWQPAVESMQAAFGERIAVIPVREDCNYILLALANHAPEPPWPHLAAEANFLRQRFGMDFPRYLRLIRQSRKRNLLGRLAS